MLRNDCTFNVLQRMYGTDFRPILYFRVLGFIIHLLASITTHHLSCTRKINRLYHTTLSKIITIIIINSVRTATTIIIIINIVRLSAVRYKTQHLRPSLKSLVNLQIKSKQMNRCLQLTLFGHAHASCATVHCAIFHWPEIRSDLVVWSIVGTSWLLHNMFNWCCG